MEPGEETIEREISVNGRARACPVRSVGDLLDELGYTADRRGIAVAVNGEVLPRGKWRDHPLNDGDAVEIVGAVQGG